MVEKIIEGVKPTRMELLGLRKRKDLAEKGHKLLSEKRDALVVQFFDIIKERKDLGDALGNELDRGRSHILASYMALGEQRVDHEASRSGLSLDLSSRTAHITGIGLPRFDLVMAGTPLLPSGIDGDGNLVMARKAYMDSLPRLVKLAELDASIERLGIEIEKTKRRVNALEHIFIPRLENTIKHIEVQLEEREREDFFRRKRIKALMDAQ